MRKTLTAAAAALVLAVAGPLATPAAQAAEAAAELMERSWSFEGVFGHYEEEQLQRGFQVYREICSACHGITRIRFRNLTEIGLTEDEVKELAAQYEVEDGPNDEGEMYMRPAELTDSYPSPYPNEQAARFANNGAYPVDLSLITKARPGGPDYVYSLMLGYEEPPEDTELMVGMYWNKYFPGHQIGMPQMIYDQMVEFESGAPNDSEALAADVTAFLMWAAEPSLEARKELGLKVMLFLIVLTALFYALYRQVWRDVEH